MYKFVLLLGLASILPANGMKIGLDELKSLAIENSYRVKSKATDVEISESKIDLAKSNLYPKLGIEAQKEWIKSDIKDESETLNSVYGEVNLFNGFKDSSRIKMEEIGVKSSKNDLGNLKFNLALEVETTYYKYLYIKKRLAVVANEMKRVKTHSRLVKKRYQSKLLTESDKIEFQLHQKKVKSLKSYLELQQEQLYSKLLQLIGKNKSDNLVIMGKIPHLNIVTSLDKLMSLKSQAPLLTKLKYQGDLANEQLKEANSNWYPTIDLKASHGKLEEFETGINSDETSSKIALTATWELFSGFETSKKREISYKKKAKIGYSTKQVNQDLSVSINSKFKTLKLLEETIEFEEENEKLANRLYRKTLEEYKKGVKDSGALLDASKKVSDLKNRVFELKLDYILAKLSLEKSLGQRLEFSLVHK